MIDKPVGESIDDIYDGGPAFPRPASDETEDSNCTHSEGMSLREYYATQVTVSEDEIEAILNSKYLITRENATIVQRFGAEAIVRFMKADAMLAVSCLPREA